MSKKKKKNRSVALSPFNPNVFDSPVGVLPGIRFRWVTPGLSQEEMKPPAIDEAKLNALKSAEPRRAMRRSPDMVEVITAWRAWDVKLTNEGWRLDALGKNCVWEPRKEISARCLNNNSILLPNPYGLHPTSQLGHPAPQMNCDCGVWAFKNLDDLVAAIGNKYKTVRVLGSVSLWGRVIETENGYRAQYAYPSELWLLDESLEELGYIYDVPVRIAQAQAEAQARES